MKFPTGSRPRSQDVHRRHVRCRDPAAERRLVEGKLCGDVVKTPVRPTHEERIVTVAADVIAGLKHRPTTRVAKQLIVADNNLVQFGPTVDVAFHETGRLQRLEHAVVVEIAELVTPIPNRYAKVRATRCDRCKARRPSSSVQHVPC